MLELGQDLRLAKETRLGDVVHPPVGPDRLDRDVPTQSLVAADPHLTHAPLAQHLDQADVPDGLVEQRHDAVPTAVYWRSSVSVSA